MIRALKKQDKEVFLSMVDSFYHSPAVLHAIPKQNMETTFEQIIEDSPYVRGYLLEHHGACAGYALLALTYSNEVGGMVVWIEELLVKEEFRGCGIGKEFFAFLETEFPDAKRFRLEVTEENDGAIRLYERLGYESLDYKQMIIDK